jgi:hypothetical protein
MRSAIGRLLCERKRVIHERERLLALLKEKRVGLLRSSLRRGFRADTQLVELTDALLIADTEHDPEYAPQRENADQDRNWNQQKTCVFSTVVDGLLHRVQTSI